MLPATGTLLVCFRGDAYDMFKFRSLNKAWGGAQFVELFPQQVTGICFDGLCVVLDSIPFIQF